MNYALLELTQNSHSNNTLQQFFTIIVYNTQYFLHRNTSQQFSVIVLHNTSTTVCYRSKLRVTFLAIFCYTFLQYYFSTILHNSLRYSSTESLHIVSTQHPLHNNTFIHVVLSINTYYIHQYYSNDQWLHYAVSTDTHKWLLQLLSCSFYHSIPLHSSQNYTSIPSSIRSHWWNICLDSLR